MIIDRFRNGDIDSYFTIIFIFIVIIFVNAIATFWYNS